MVGQENGLDIEGIAVEGDRVWLGLRGPVLGGHAVAPRSRTFIIGLNIAKDCRKYISVTIENQIDCCE